MFSLSAISRTSSTPIISGVSSIPSTSEQGKGSFPIDLGVSQKNVRLGYLKLTPCIRIGGMKDNFVSDTFRHFFGQKWHLSHQNTQLKAYFG